MRRLRSIRARLALSHLAVVAAGTGSVLIVAQLVAPTFYRSHMASMGMGGMDAMMTDLLQASFEEAFREALRVALVVSVAVALGAAYLATRRMARPIDDVRSATGRLAEGHLSERVVEPVEAELAALARDVNHLAETLEQTERRRSQLLGEVSHELRHPIATIEGYLEGMLDGVLEPTPEILAAMTREVTRLGRLASDLNLVSRAEEGALPLARQRIEVADVVADTVNRLRPQFADEGVDVTVTPGSGATIDADPDRIAQVLTNLVGNALTYTPAGGAVDIGWTIRPGRVEITVTDTGSGIPPDDLERVFDRFYRGDRSAPGGTGVGLTIARSIARLHGGDITASSAGPGRGSTFRLDLPI